MKQPWYKRYLSHLMEVRIEESASVFNDHLVVLLSKGEYQLCTPEAIYSYGKRYDNFYTALKKCSLPQNQSEALILGLGLASIPYMIENYFDRTYGYTCVEIDPEVIRLAETYVLDELSSPMVIYETDALHFVKRESVPYDFIAIDIFVSDYIPEEFQSEAFLRDTNRQLAKGGLLLLNRLYLYDHDKVETEAYYSSVFKKVFPHATYLEINGNWMLINDMRFLK